MMKMVAYNIIYPQKYQFPLSSVHKIYVFRLL